MKILTCNWSVQHPNAGRNINTKDCHAGTKYGALHLAWLSLVKNYDLTISKKLFKQLWQNKIKYDSRKIIKVHINKNL